MQSKWRGRVVRLPSEKAKIRILFNNAYYSRYYKPSETAKEWYSYLKKNGLFKRYIDRIFELIYNGVDSHYLLNLTRYEQIKYVCESIDAQVSSNGTWHWWQDRYDDFCWKRESSIVNHKMSAKLYRVNVKDKPHSKYIGSSELRKSLYDKVIDGFFNLFK